MEVYLVDGTYELFRHYFAVPSTTDETGQEIAAVRGVMNSVLSMLREGVTHIAVATDHVIESFRNDLYEHYKTGDGIPEDLFSQFPLLEDSLEAMGVVVWRMVEFEADDALASAAQKAIRDDRVERVVICTPDKDLAQCVTGRSVVQLDRRKRITRDEQGVWDKFGVHPRSIPDYLAVVGDTADGFPGLPGWGAKSAASVLSIYPHLEDIPEQEKNWDSSIRSSKRLAGTLREQWEEALLFRTLATLRNDAPTFNSVDELLWPGPRPSLDETCQRLSAPNILKRARALAEGN